MRAYLVLRCRQAVRYKGYHQIPVHPADVKKMVIIMPFGLFEFIRMPFGLKNTSMTFQRFMGRVLAGLPFILVYLDNILVASADRQSHTAHLRLVLERLQENGLVLNSSKCQFYHSEVEFLGLRVTAGGVAPLPAQIATIQDFPQPATVKELQGFLGAVNFYRRFIPAAANILLQLTAFLKGGKKGADPGLVPSDDNSFFQHQSCSTHFCLPGLSPGQSRAVFGPRRLGDTRWCCSTTEGDTHHRMAALRLLLGEVGASPAVRQCI